MRLHNAPNLKLYRQQLRHDATLPERLIWNELRTRSFGYKFRRQYSIGRYILDFYCSPLKLAIEIDGAQHWEPEQNQYDRTRTIYLESLGLTVARYPANEVLKNLKGVVENIRHQYERMTSPPPTPPLPWRGGGQ